MKSKKDLVAIVPARSGSKRVPQKNRLLIGDKSLLARTVECIESSGCIDRTILCTNDSELVREAANFPNVQIAGRPDDISGDEATTEDLIAHVIAAQSLRGRSIVLLQLTSPFRTGADIAALLSEMNRKGSKSGVAVCRWRIPPSRPFGPRADLDTLGRGPEFDYSQMRAFEDECWAVNGAIYIFQADAYGATGKFYDENSAIHVMQNWRSIDIDYDDDVDIARAIAEAKKI